MSGYVLFWRSFQPHSQNQILVPLRGFFQNTWRTHPPQWYGTPSGVFTLMVLFTFLNLDSFFFARTPENLVIHWHKNSAMPHTMVCWLPCFLKSSYSKNTYHKLWHFHKVWGMSSGGLFNFLLAHPLAARGQQSFPWGSCLAFAKSRGVRQDTLPGKFYSWMYDRQDNQRGSQWD